MSMFSQIMTRSGTMTVIGRNNALRPSGRADRPKYPGFIVMYAPHVSLSFTTSPSMVVMRACSSNGLPDFLEAFWAVTTRLTPAHTALNWTVHTESTSGISRLNSSKQPQLPLQASPLKMLPSDL